MSVFDDESKLVSIANNNILDDSLVDYQKYVKIYDNRFPNQPVAPHVALLIARVKEVLRFENLYIVPRSAAIQESIWMLDKYGYLINNDKDRTNPKSFASLKDTEVYKLCCGMLCSFAAKVIYSKEAPPVYDISNLDAVALCCLATSKHLRNIYHNRAGIEALFSSFVHYIIAKTYLDNHANADRCATLSTTGDGGTMIAQKIWYAKDPESLSNSFIGKYMLPDIASIFQSFPLLMPSVSVFVDCVMHWHANGVKVFEHPKAFSTMLFLIGHSGFANWDSLRKIIGIRRGPNIERYNFFDILIFLYTAAIRTNPFSQITASHSFPKYKLTTMGDVPFESLFEDPMQGLSAYEEIFKYFIDETNEDHDMVRALQDIVHLNSNVCEYEAVERLAFIHSILESGSLLDPHDRQYVETLFVEHMDYMETSKNWTTNVSPVLLRLSRTADPVGYTMAIRQEMAYKELNDYVGEARQVIVNLNSTNAMFRLMNERFAEGREALAAHFSSPLVREDSLLALRTNNPLTAGWPLHQYFGICFDRQASNQIAGDVVDNESGREIIASTTEQMSAPVDDDILPDQENRDEMQASNQIAGDVVDNESGREIIASTTEQMSAPVDDDILPDQENRDEMQASNQIAGGVVDNESRREIIASTTEQMSAPVDDDILPDQENRDEMQASNQIAGDVVDNESGREIIASTTEQMSAPVDDDILPDQENRDEMQASNQIAGDVVDNESGREIIASTTEQMSAPVDDDILPDQENRDEMQASNQIAGGVVDNESRREIIASTTEQMSAPVDDDILPDQENRDEMQASNQIAGDVVDNESGREIIASTTEQMSAPVDDDILPDQENRDEMQASNQIAGDVVDNESGREIIASTTEQMSAPVDDDILPDQENRDEMQASNQIAGGVVDNESRREIIASTTEQMSAPVDDDILPDQENRDEMQASNQIAGDVVDNESGREIIASTTEQMSAPVDDDILPDQENRDEMQASNQIAGDVVDNESGREIIASTTEQMSAPVDDDILPDQENRDEMQASNQIAGDVVDNESGREIIASTTEQMSAPVDDDILPDQENRDEMQASNQIAGDVVDNESGREIIASTTEQMSAPVDDDILPDQENRDEMQASNQIAGDVVDNESGREIIASTTEQMSAPVDDDILPDQENRDEMDPNENVDFDAFDGGVIHARNGKFAFNRTRDETAVFPEDVVTVLSNPIKETGSGCAEQLEIIDADVFRAQFAATKVYLIGTAHFSRASQQDVLHTIKATQPDMVFIELCPQRMNVLEINEEVWMRDAQDFSQGRIFSLFKELGFAQGLLQSLLTPEHIAKELGMPPCSRLCFGGRPFSVTIKRALRSLSFFQRLRFLYHLFLSIDTKITAEDVERVKERDLLGEILLEMAGDFPLLAKIFIDERDLYMTDVLHKLVANITMEKMIVSATDGIPYQPVNIVAVVGMGHVPGIVKNWENFDIDVAELMTIPEPSTAAKVFKVAVRLTVGGAVLYGVYRVGTFTFGKIRPLL